MNHASTTTKTTTRRLRLGLLATLVVVASSASLPNEEGKAQSQLRGRQQHRSNNAIIERSLNSVLAKDNLFQHEERDSIDDEDETGGGIGIGDAEVTAIEDFYMGDGETIITLVDEVEIVQDDTRPPIHNPDDYLFQTAHPFSGDQTVPPFQERPIPSGEVGNDNGNDDYNDALIYESFPPKPDFEETPADFDTNFEAPPADGTVTETETETGSVAQEEIQVVPFSVRTNTTSSATQTLPKKTNDEEELFEEEETKLVRDDNDSVVEENLATTSSVNNNNNNNDDNNNIDHVVPTKHYLIFAGLCVTLLLLYMMYWRDSIISQRLEFLLKQQEARDRLKNLHDNVDDESISIDERDFGQREGGNFKFYHSNSHLNNHNNNKDDDDDDDPESFPENLKTFKPIPPNRISDSSGNTFPDTEDDDDATRSLSPPMSPESKEHWKKYETIGL